MPGSRPGIFICSSTVIPGRLVEPGPESISANAAKLGSKGRIAFTRNGVFMDSGLDLWSPRNDSAIDYLNQPFSLATVSRQSLSEPAKDKRR